MIRNQLASVNTENLGNYNKHHLRKKSPRNTKNSENAMNSMNSPPRRTCDNSQHKSKPASQQIHYSAQQQDITLENSNIKEHSEIAIKPKLVADGLFYQQLQAFSIMEQRSGSTKSQGRLEEKQSQLMSLMKEYISAKKPDVNKNHQDAKNNGNSNVLQNPHQRKDKSDLVTSSWSDTINPKCNSNQLEKNLKKKETNADSKVKITEQKVYPTTAPVKKDIDGEKIVDESAISRILERSASPPPNLPLPSDIIDSLEYYVEAVFTNESIGMVLRSNAEKRCVFIKEISPRSEASKQEAIRIGLYVLAINGRKAYGKPLREVLQMLSSAPRPTVVCFGQFAKTTAMQFSVGL